MKTKFMTLAAILATSALTISCIEEIQPQTSTVTVEQAANAPGSYDNFVNAITSSLCGQFTYSAPDTDPYDFGYPSFFLQRDVMGQDIVPVGDHCFGILHEGQNRLCWIDWEYEGEKGT